MSNTVGDLVKTLFQVGRDGKDIPHIAERHLFSKVNALFIVVGGVESRDATDALWSESGSSTVGAAPIKRNAHDSHVIVSHKVGVFEVGCLHEGVDTSKVRELATGKGRNGLVVDRGSTWKPNLQSMCNLFIKFRGGECAFLK